MKNTEPTKKKTSLASLFSDQELKGILHQYLVWMAVLEGLIFFVCWIYSLGFSPIGGGERENPGFPWSVYFLVAFLAPVGVTFLLGIITMAFNRFAFDQEAAPDDIPADQAAGRIGKMRKAFSIFNHVPFLISLLLIALLAGVIYKLDAILSFAARFGEFTARVVLIGGGVVLGAGIIYFFLRMWFDYKLRKQDLDFEYKREVMDRLGIAILDDKTIVNSEGHVLTTNAAPRALPPGPKPQPGQPGRGPAPKGGKPGPKPPKAPVSGQPKSGQPRAGQPKPGPAARSTAPGAPTDAEYRVVNDTDASGPRSGEAKPEDPAATVKSALDAAAQADGQAPTDRAAAPKTDPEY